MTKKIRRQININGVKKWICGNTEQEYADNLIREMEKITENKTCGEKPRKHNFETYARRWFEVFSSPNMATVTGITYERQLRLHIFPVLGEMDIEDILPADIQRIFNGIEGARETKVKVKTVLNMIFQQAMEDELITRNPLQSRNIRLNGRGSNPTEPYSVEQMRFLVQQINRIKRPQDRTYLALHALHPLRLEEVLGLKWKDVDLERNILRIRRAVVHPERNRPLIKDTKTQASQREMELIPQIACYLPGGNAEDFVLGGNKPLSYTEVKRMCQRIQRETGFEEAITPRRFRTTVLSDIYDTTKDIRQTQMVAGHTTATMTLRHYVKNRQSIPHTAQPIARAYGLEN